jgi:hypothetical protein
MLSTMRRNLPLAIMAFPTFAKKLVESFGGSDHVYESLQAVDQNSNEDMLKSKPQAIMRQHDGALKYAFLSILGSFVLVTVSIFLGVSSTRTGYRQSTLPRAHRWWPESQCTKPISRCALLMYLVGTTFRVFEPNKDLTAGDPVVATSSRVWATILPGKRFLSKANSKFLTACSRRSFCKDSRSADLGVRRWLSHSRRRGHTKEERAACRSVWGCCLPPARMPSKLSCPVLLHFRLLSI